MDSNPLGLLRAPRRWHRWGPPWHSPADVPALRVELLGRALHPQPQLQAEDGPGALHPSRAPGPPSWWLPSPTLVSFCPVCPVPPAGRPLPPSSLGFLPEETREEAPDPGVRGAAGRGSRECCCPGYFWPWLPPCHGKGHPGAQHSHTGAGTCLNISPVAPHSPCAILYHPQNCFSQCSPNPNKHPVPPPASTPMSHPMALPAPGRGSEEGSPCPPWQHSLTYAGLGRAAGHCPTSPVPRSFVSADAQETPFSYPRPAQPGGLRAGSTPWPRRN